MVEVEALDLLNSWYVPILEKGGTSELTKLL